MRKKTYTSQLTVITDVALGLAIIATVVFNCLWFLLLTIPAFLVLIVLVYINLKTHRQGSQRKENTANDNRSKMV